MPANPDFKDLFKLFNEERVDYLVVGAHAVIFHAEPRYTKDLDIWVAPEPSNAARVWQALRRFGAPLNDITPADFCDEQIIYQIGVAPNRIDILMSVTGLVFRQAYARRVLGAYDGEPIPILARADLIRAKQTSNRPQDQLDVGRLQQTPAEGASSGPVLPGAESQTPLSFQPEQPGQ